MLTCLTAPPAASRRAFGTEVGLFRSIGLFYSYATCGGDHSAFTSFELASNQQQLVVVIPSIAYSPYHYKRDQPGGAPLTSSAPYELSHYRDDSVPWEGVLVQYFAKLAGGSCN